MPEELTPEQIDEYWTRLGQMKKQFESFAKSYIKTLEQFKPDAPNPQQQKIVENVRNYLYVFLRLCADSREQAKRAPSLKALDGCEKTLQAVWKRAARKRQAAGGQATPFGSPTGAAQGSPMAGTPMPPERMQKWGFLVKHERWLAVEGYSVTVFSKAPEPDVKPAQSQAPVEMSFQLTDCHCTKETAESPLAFSLTSSGGGRAIFIAESQEQFDRWWARLSQTAAGAGVKRPRTSGSSSGGGGGGSSSRSAGGGAVHKDGGGGPGAAAAPAASGGAGPPPPSAPPPSAPPPAGPPAVPGAAAPLPAAKDDPAAAAAGASVPPPPPAPP